MQHFIIIVAQKRKLEAVFGWVKSYGPWTCGAVKAVDSLALDAGEVHRIVKCADNTVVTMNV